VAVALSIPGAAAGAAMRPQAQVPAASTFVAVSLKADTPSRPGAVNPDYALFYMDAKGNPGGPISPPSFTRSTTFAR
jgi:hypothetical protein